MGFSLFPFLTYCSQFTAEQGVSFHMILLCFNPALASHYTQNRAQAIPWPARLCFFAQNSLPSLIFACLISFHQLGLCTNIMALERSPLTTPVLSLSHHSALFPSQ